MCLHSTFTQYWEWNPGSSLTHGRQVPYQLSYIPDPHARILRGELWIVRNISAPGLYCLGQRYHWNPLSVKALATERPTSFTNFPRLAHQQPNENVFFTVYKNLPNSAA